MTDHTLASIRPYVIRDLAEARHTSVEDWLEMHVGINRATFARWSAKIAKAKLFLDEDIQTHLIAYCRSNGEAGRYTPFIELLKCIKDKVRNILPLAGTRRTKYPIDDITFKDHSNKYVIPNREHGALAAMRRPDVVWVREDAAAKDRVTWDDMLSWCELKASKSLREPLDNAREARGLPRVFDELDDAPAAPAPAADKKVSILLLTCASCIAYPDSVAEAESRRWRSSCEEAKGLQRQEA